MVPSKVHFFITSYHSQGWGQILKKLTNESFYGFSFDSTEEKVTVRFEGKRVQFMR